jgi:hypothetical protein
MDLPVHASVVAVSMAVRLLERYGVDIMLCSCCKTAKRELLYVRHPMAGKRQEQRE